MVVLTVIAVVVVVVSVLVVEVFLVHLFVFFGSVDDAVFALLEVWRKCGALEDVGTLCVTCFGRILRRARCGTEAGTYLI